jgi:hypothetical protein
MKPNAFSRRRLATKPSFSRKRNRPCLRKRKSKHKRERATNRVECQLKKVCYEAAIQSEAKPTLPQEEKEQVQERDIYKERKIEQ